MSWTDTSLVILVLAGGIALTGGGCAGTLSVGDPLGGDDAVGDDDATGDDDVTGDDDTGDDDATGDDDVTGDDDTTDEPDMSTWTGSREVILDFSEYAEEYAGKVDCGAPYEMNGVEMTADYQDLCPVCAFVFAVNHDPDPAASDCLDQAYISASNFDALYGIQMSSETEFILWRNDGGEGTLEVYGEGAIDGSDFNYETAQGDAGWYAWWVEGQGTLGG